MDEWKALVEKVKSLKSIIDKDYIKHEPLIKYLDKENLLKVDLTVKAPKYNVSEDVKNFIQLAE